MAVAFTELTAVSQYDNANNTAFDTPTLTAEAGKLYVIDMHVGYSNATPRTLTSVAGGGLGDWTIIAGASVESTSQTRRSEMAFATSASPGAGAAVTITWSGGTTGCSYSVYEVTGFNTSDPIGEADIARGSSTSGTPTLGSATAGSGIIAGCQTITSEAMSAEAGWSAGENHTGSNHSLSALSATRTNIDDLSCTFSWTTSGTFTSNIVEILAAAGSILSLVAADMDSMANTGGMRG
jgi:hypothetical protein